MPKISLPILRNYYDAKCAWGYMTLCKPCEARAPSHVDLRTTVAGFPQVQCELCGVRSA